MKSWRSMGLALLFGWGAVCPAAVVEFAGRTWNIRESPGDPGQNEWATDCAWKDANGLLHLQVKGRGGQWYCGEVESPRSANYGEYRWQTTGRLDTLDPNIVAGLFTFGEPWGYNEIDFEFTYGFEPVTNNLHYTIQPWWSAGHMYKRRFAQASADMTHSYVWAPGSIRWRSWYGHCPAPSSTASVVADWTYAAPDVPEDGSEHIYMNCWLVNHTIVTINESNQYQAMEGFGASLTDSSAWLLQTGLTGAERTNLLRALFSPTEGIGLNLLRQPIGASDMRLRDYTYDDRPAGQTDYALTNFSIAYDQGYIIPMLQAIRGIQTNLHILGTAWSPPAWMKDNGHLYGGRLKADAYSAYAAYLRKFVQAYTAAGLPVHAVTLQNEPLWGPWDYPGMQMEATNQAAFAKLVGRDFATNGLTTKLFCYDHNWNNPGYPITVLNDPAVKAVLAGTAFHGYEGDVTNQTTVHRAHPDRDIYFTELTGGSWATNFGECLTWDVRTLIIEAARNWASAVTKWNLALDPYGGPKINGGCGGCWGLVTVNTATHAIATNYDFYALGHASKFIRRGARRIDAVEVEEHEPYTVAFQNPGSNLVVVACNPLPSTHAFTFRWRGQAFDYSLPAKSAATFTWPARLGAPVEVWLTTGDRAHLLEQQPAGLAFRDGSALWTNWPASELIVKDFSFMPLAGTNVFDEFDDGARRGLWSPCGVGDVIETDGVLRVLPADQNWFSVGYGCDVDRPKQGFETVFSANLRGVTVTRANTGWDQPGDLRVFLSVFEDDMQCDPYWVANAITLRGDYDSGTDSMRVQVFTKNNLPSSDGTPRFDGTISGLASYADTNGLDLQIALQSSNYTVRILRGGAPVPIAVASGSLAGPLNTGRPLGACRMFVGGGNADTGRGAVYWNRAAVIFNPEPLVTGAVPSADTVWVGISSTATFSVAGRTNALGFEWSLDQAIVQRDTGSGSSLQIGTTPELIGPHAVGVRVRSGPNVVYARDWLLLVGDGDSETILHWPFDADGRDLSGWGNNIHVEGDGAIGWDGVSGRALELAPP